VTDLLTDKISIFQTRSYEPFHVYVCSLLTFVRIQYSHISDIRYVIWREASLCNYSHNSYVVYIYVVFINKPYDRANNINCCTCYIALFSYTWPIVSSAARVLEVHFCPQLDPVLRSYRVWSSAVSNNSKILRRLIVTRKFMDLLAKLKRPERDIFPVAPPPPFPQRLVASYRVTNRDFSFCSD
jgi:hypothetical protein